jgi:hypothetical protein
MDLDTQTKNLVVIGSLRTKMAEAKRRLDAAISVHDQVRASGESPEIIGAADKISTEAASAYNKVYLEVLDLQILIDRSPNTGAYTNLAVCDAAFVVALAEYHIAVAGLASRKAAWEERALKSAQETLEAARVAVLKAWATLGQTYMTP